MQKRSAWFVLFLCSACGNDAGTAEDQHAGMPASNASGGAGGTAASASSPPSNPGGTAGDDSTPSTSQSDPGEPGPSASVPGEPEPLEPAAGGSAGGPPDLAPNGGSAGAGTAMPNGGGGAASTEPEPIGGGGAPVPEVEPDVAVAGGGSGGSAPVSMGEPVQAELAPMSIARGEHGVGVLGDEVYVMCGFTPSVTSRVQVYTPETDTWRDAADVPIVCHHPNVATVGDRLFILGFHAGMGQRMADGTSFSYDAAADEWTEVAPQPPGTERGASCVTTYQDKVYVFGGTNDIALAEASTYDPTTDEWEPLPLLPMPRHHCIAAVVNDLIYIVSGRDVVIEEVHTESFVFDPVAQTYEEVAPILTPRGGGAGGELGGRIYVFGGEGNTADDRGIFHEAEVYDPVTDTWASLPDMLVPRHGLGAAVIGDRMYLPGGSTSQGIDSQETMTVFYLQ